MFDSKEAALDHRDQVLDVLVDTLNTDSVRDQPFHIHPVLDGAVVRIQQDDLDAVTAAIEDQGFSVEELGETGDWFELKAKPDK